MFKVRFGDLFLILFQTFPCDAFATVLVSSSFTLDELGDNYHASLELLYLIRHIIGHRKHQ